MIDYLKFKNSFKILLSRTLIFFSISLLTSCDAIKYKKVDSSVPMSGEERAKRNIAEGRGVSLGGLRNSRTTYEFSTSNPLWRASLETLDFLPLTVVDYSGGIIVSDWYSSQGEDALKITIRFLSNEIRADSLKIIVHQKKCGDDTNCKVIPLNTRIISELTASIIKKAAIIDKEIQKK